MPQFLGPSQHRGLLPLNLTWYLSSLTPSPTPATSPLFSFLKALFKSWEKAVTATTCTHSVPDPFQHPLVVRRARHGLPAHTGGTEGAWAGGQQPGDGAESRSEAGGQRSDFQVSPRGRAGLTLEEVPTVPALFPRRRRGVVSASREPPTNSSGSFMHLEVEGEARGKAGSVGELCTESGWGQRL